MIKTVNCPDAGEILSPAPKRRKVTKALAFTEFSGVSMDQMRSAILQQSVKRIEVKRARVPADLQSQFQMMLFTATCLEEVCIEYNGQYKMLAGLAESMMLQKKTFKLVIYDPKKELLNFIDHLRNCAAEDPISDAMEIGLIRIEF